MSVKSNVSSPDETSGTSRKLRRTVASVAAGALIAGMAVLGGTLPAQASGAAEQGIGIGSLDGGSAEFPSNVGGWTGSFYVPGVGFMYCVNPGLENGVNSDPETVSDYNRTYSMNAEAYPSQTVTAEITPREAFEISWIVANYGQLDAPRTGYSQEQAAWAAAVEVAVASRAVPSMTGPRGNSITLQQFLQPRWQGRYDVDTKIAQINAAVAGQNPSATGTGAGSVAINMTNYTQGEAVVSMSPADAIATLTITGGTFPGGATTISGVSNGQRIPVTGNHLVDPANPHKQYDIRITGSATGSGSGFAEQMLLARSDGQDLVRPATAVPVTFDLTAGVADPLIEFSPVVTTKAPEFVQQGANFADVLTANVADAANPAAGPWAQFNDSSYVPVKAKGTLYGPMLAIPDESATAPSWAPIAGTAEATLNGPGDYTVNTDFASKESGYYTWVWNIDSADQDTIAKTLLPQGYKFQDRFAQKVETSVTPSGIVATSKVSDAEVAIGDPVTDTLSVSTAASAGGWLQKDGKRIPVTFRGTAYFVPGDTAPVVSDTVPAGAERVGSTTLTATGPGDYTSPAINAPEGKGFMTWVWSIDQADQPDEFKGYVRDWSDQFGIPAETSKVTVPVVATKAQTDVPVGDTFHDVATVSGAIPKAGVDLHFELYEAKKGADGNWVCEAGNLLWTSSSQTVTTAGSYTSAEAPFQPVGEYHWVEVLTTKGGKEISRGICGVPEETTKVVKPEVTTKAQPATTLGGTINDVATVTGPIAKGGYDLTFEAYKVPYVKDTTTGAWKLDAPADAKDGDLSWVCKTEPVFTTKEPVKVSAAGEFPSEAFTPTEHAKYLWVETLTYNPTAEQGGKSTVVHRGECGVREESSFVVDVTTQAQERGKAGETATDTAIVNGFVPEGSTVEFSAYKVDINAPQAPNAAEVCTEGSLLKTTDAVAVPGGMHEGTKIVSAAVDLPKSDGDYKVYWIETVKDELGNVIAHGECGLPSETTTVEKSDAELAWTGGNSTAALWAGGIALLGLIAGAGIYTARRRQNV